MQIFFVIEGKGKSLLGRNTAEQLGVLRVGFVRGINTGQDILAEYPECFEGIGKLKGFKAKLYVDGNVRPVAQPVRRIPNNLTKLLSTTSSASKSGTDRTTKHTPELYIYILL